MPKYYEEIGAEDDNLVEGSSGTASTHQVSLLRAGFFLGVFIAFLVLLVVVFTAGTYFSAMSRSSDNGECSASIAYTPFTQANYQPTLNKGKRAADEKPPHDSLPDESSARAVLNENPVPLGASRFSVKPGSVLIKNVTIWTVNANDEELKGYDLLIEAGLITQIAQNIATPNGFGGQVVDGGGRYVTPGLVDMHSHVGVSSFPSSFGLEDTNEMTDPTTSYVRTMDAIYPNDPSIYQILSGGVTTSLILPGSANVMGGQASLVKMRGTTVGELLIPGAKGAVKMACGENPKRVYGANGKMPSTRMGIGWKFRERFHDAATLRAEQQVWDCNKGKGRASGVRPANIQLENLVGIMNNDLMLMVHCYMVHDFEMVIRTSKEFNFTIKAFHHALEAWKIPAILKDNNIAVATFASKFGFKMEGYDGSTKGVKILTDAGVLTAIKTDHPVIYAKYFMFEAAQVYHYGLTWQQAMRAVTINPAKAIELDKRIGSIEVGKDGDIVMWDRFPLQIGAQPRLVIVEGNTLVETTSAGTAPIPSPTGTMTSTGPSTCSRSATPLVVRGVSDLANGIQNATLVVQSGVLLCYAAYPGCEASVATLGPSVNEYLFANGAQVTPGFVLVDSDTGQSEVDQEDDTQNGRSQPGEDYKVCDGVRLTNYKNRHIEAAYNAGVTSVIGYSPSGGVMAGQASAFFITPGTQISQSLIADSVALTVTLGNNAKSGMGSVSREIQYLREALKSPTNGATQAVMNGSLLLLAVVNQVDEIDALLRLKAELNIPRVAIKGGAEAYLIASRIAAANVSVIVKSRAEPEFFETYHAVDDNSKRLFDAGVQVAINWEVPESVRNLRWEGAFAMERGVPYASALAMVTSNVAKIFGVSSTLGSLAAGAPANFVVFDGHPFGILSRPLLVVTKDNTVCNPTQF